MSQAPMTAEEFMSAGDVSRETFARLKIYEGTLRQWQERINLVSRNTLDDVWRRHFLDSLQLAKWVEPGRRVLDMGSGAGFPGMVVAIVTGAPVRLAESDARKCAFLREVRRLTDAPAEIEEGRVEDMDDQFDIVMARALAPLKQLLAYAEPLLATAGTCLFLKGSQAADELTDAAEIWNMDVEQHPSASDPRGVVLRIRNLERV